MPTPNAYVDGSTRLTGLLGWPVHHSLSPGMQNAAFASAGLNYCYLALPVAPEQLAHAVAGLRAMNSPGWNITIPHKQAIMPLLDTIDNAAKAIGAVNTVVNYEGKLNGYNTDVAGFRTGLRQAGIVRPDRSDVAVVLGSGGAARAVVWSMAESGVGMQVKILSRRPEQAEALISSFAPKLANRMSAAPLDSATLNAILPGAAVLINCTPAGTWPHVDESPLPDDVELPAHLLVYDLIYNPRRTKLLQKAAASGCRTQDGLTMLVYQGAYAFRLWTGRDADIPAMQAAVENALRHE